MKYLILSIFSINIFCMPWLESYDAEKINEIERKISSCPNNIFLYSSYPVAYGNIIFQINNFLVNKNLNIECINELKDLKFFLENSYKDGKKEIGYQSGYDNILIQDFGKRAYRDPHIYLLKSGVSNNLAYQIRISNNIKTNEILLDDSYVSLKSNNNIFSIGRKSRWWSPSERSSLILSNSARPTFGFELKNYNPIIPKSSFLQFLGAVDYEFFINKLEKERTISNTLLFGNRVTFYPNSDLKLSLLRLAQFGGDGRPEDAKTIFNMLIGRDNTSENLTFKEQPGNQLAGIDFVYNPSYVRNLKIYGQSIGEDEAGMFPSRKFSLVGLNMNINLFDIPMSVSFDSYDTFSGIKNYTYNHGLYKDGLRYYQMPIGAAIDADSEEKSTTFKLKLKNNINLKLVIRDSVINKNNSKTNFLSNQRLDINGYDLGINYRFKNLTFDLLYIRNTSSNNKNDLLFRLLYSY